MENLKSIQAIAVEIKTVYGKQNIYPACDIAKSFISALGYKTLTKEHLKALKALRIRVVQVYNGIEVGEL